MFTLYVGTYHGPMCKKRIRYHNAVLDSSSCAPARSTLPTYGSNHFIGRIYTDQKYACSVVPVAYASRSKHTPKFGVIFASRRP